MSDDVWLAEKPGCTKRRAQVIRMTYPNAPITEAVLDIRVEPREGIQAKELLNVTERISNSYPVREDCVEGTASFSLGSTMASSIQSNLIGYLCRSEDARICQAQLRGFSFSKLRPYLNWEDTKTEARRLWNIYRMEIRPTKVTRLALRYINKIEIPIDGPLDLNKFFRTRIEISSDLPQSMENFYMKLQLPQPDIRSMGVINSTVLPTENKGVVGILLDIDVSRTVDLPQTEEDIWDVFDQIRDSKNKIFEASITDSTRELFQ